MRTWTVERFITMAVNRDHAVYVAIHGVLNKNSMGWSKGCVKLKGIVYEAVKWIPNGDADVLGGVMA